MRASDLPASPRAASESRLCAQPRLPSHALKGAQAARTARNEDVVRDCVSDADTLKRGRNSFLFLLCTLVMLPRLIGDTLFASSPTLGNAGNAKPFSICDKSLRESFVE